MASIIYSPGWTGSVYCGCSILVRGAGGNVADGTRAESIEGLVFEIVLGFLAKRGS